jgi:hypothetical protein
VETDLTRMCELLVGLPASPTGIYSPPPRPAGMKCLLLRSS